MNNRSPQIDPNQRARLRWRARRGLLENDLLISRFLDHHETTLSDEEVSALYRLLELSDHDLLDILLSRQVLDKSLMTPTMAQLIARLQVV